MENITPDKRFERDLDNKLVDEAIASENIKKEFERLRPLYKEWIEDYCNVTFDDNKMPSAVGLALDELVETDPKSFNIQSEKLSDMSITYGNGGSGSGGGGGAIPNYILGLLEPYRRSHLLSDKRKRPYDNGRG